MKHLFSNRGGLGVAYAGTLYLVLDPVEKLKKTEVIALFSLSLITHFFFADFYFLLFIFHARPDVLQQAILISLFTEEEEEEEKKDREIKEADSSNSMVCGDETRRRLVQPAEMTSVLGDVYTTLFLFFFSFFIISIFKYRPDNAQGSIWKMLGEIRKIKRVGKFFFFFFSIILANSG